jgi:hypothetical protein
MSASPMLVGGKGEGEMEGGICPLRERERMVLPSTFAWGFLNGIPYAGWWRESGKRKGEGHCGLPGKETMGRGNLSESIHRKPQTMRGSAHWGNGHLWVPESWCLPAAFSKGLFPWLCRREKRNESRNDSLKYRDWGSPCLLTVFTTFSSMVQSVIRRLPNSLFPTRKNYSCQDTWVYKKFIKS